DIGALGVDIVLTGRDLQLGGFAANELTFHDERFALDLVPDFVFVLRGSGGKYQLPLGEGHVFRSLLLHDVSCLLRRSWRNVLLNGEAGGRLRRRCGRRDYVLPTLVG